MSTARQPVQPSPESESKQEDAHEEGEERYGLIIQGVKDYAIFLVDAEGHIRTWNAGAEAIKGYTPREAIGRHISMFYTPEDQAAGRPARLFSTAAQEGRVEDEGWRVRKDGTRFWADVVITALRDKDGKLQGFSKVTRDLTARREAEEALRQSELRFRLLVQSVKEYAIFMLDPRGHVASWNAGAARIKGYAPEEIIGQHFSRFYPPEEATSGKCAWELEVALAEGRFEEEGWRVRKDGTRFWANVVIQPVRDSEGRHIGFAKVTRDLTERRKAEEERLRLAQAQEAVRLRDEFLSIASHELKTPLSAIQLQLQSLLHGAKDLEPKLRNKAERAFRGGERLTQLVEALLDVSRIATGRFSLTLETCDLGRTVEEVVERFREQASRDGCELTLRLEENVTGEWDRLRLEQVVTNLLSNALRYAAGTPVELAVRAEGDHAVLTVSDQGPGIPESEWERIFARFERAASMRHYGGMGLGLYVSRQIVEGHGGTISIEAVKPQGARFIVTLPRSPRKGAGPDASAEAEVAR
ncbi:PAS domain-containing sensor histidine kinase [Pyxidicoccus fallax]|uniref:histidine kinase n=1 Tax=Pyxidicoccus fallax TaxID=394095 RepID=A0A848LNV2_9BACT|nr:PAS domain-containing sensor histidine kinase [Pyxidicoccus fallax]NMO19528.1 PAS domain-containing sensor histidine kinase [Pyxidicoccus fallax]NPC82781.1 PAS domain-containing sensor histidine kinase [Pyxidicoccus fallax]